MTSPDLAYSDAGRALAGALRDQAEEAALRRIEAEYRREERAGMAESDALRAASSATVEAAPFFPGVLGITDPRTGDLIRARVPEGPMEAETLGFRLSKAAGHAAIGLQREQQADHLDGRVMAKTLELAPGADRAVVDALAEAARHARASAEWHRGRGRGELERFERLDTCEDDVALWQCREPAGGCGEGGVTPVRCGSKFCVTCRAAAAHHARQRFAVGRLDRVQALAKAGVLRRRVRGGRWSEKFFTVTVPHVRWEAIAWSEVPSWAKLPPPSTGETDRDVVARIFLLSTAWRLFWIEVWKDLRERYPDREVRKLIAMHRSFEWTPGADGLGHPHFHAYLFCPFLRQDDLHAWWAAALRKAGWRQGPDDADPICPDVREIKTRPADIAFEVSKGRGNNLKLASGSAAGTVHAYACSWSIAEYAQGETRARPAVLARVYEALSDRRLSQATPGFLPPRLRGCPQCGLQGSVAFELLPPGTTASEALDRFYARCAHGPHGAHERAPDTPPRPPPD